VLVIRSVEFFNLQSGKQHHRVQLLDLSCKLLTECTDVSKSETQMKKMLKNEINHLEYLVIPGTRCPLSVTYIRTFHGNVEPIVSEIFHSLGAANFLMLYTM
jgi:hypothetical protein